MIIKDLFRKDITRSIQGVVTIGNEDEEQKWQELEEYVCTNEIIKSFRIFFRKYRESLATPTSEMGVWITGFFGSGKSHFLKILGYILENEEIAGQKAVTYFDDKIQDAMVLADIRACANAKNKVVLFNIDSKAKSTSKQNTEAIMDIMLRSFNESVGYCGSSPWVADMERTLNEEGKLQDFITKFEELSKRNWQQTRAKALLNRDAIIQALVAVRGMSEESARTFVDDQTKNFTNTTEEFAKIVNDYCIANKTRVIFLMDEVGQFIGDNAQLMLNLQTCSEDLGKFCHGQAWIVVTSQQELKAMIDSTKEKQYDFSKIQGRFKTRLLLSGANADEVIKRRILEKKDTAATPLKALYDANSSKLANLILFQAKPSWSGYRDAEDFKNVYPFVSYQFELLQKVFEAIREHGMSEGKHLSQNERSLLDAFQTSAKKYAENESGLLVPFDDFYQTIEQFIDYDIKTVFSNAERKDSLLPLDIRVLRVLFMIKHVKDMPATIDRLATLLVKSIQEDKAALKNDILESLNRLEEETLIQKNGDEYDFLTNAEQDVNRQINTSGYNEAEVQRNIMDIIYDKILENNKFRYEGRYDFGLNRFVDNESKGPVAQDNMTIKVCTQFSGPMSPVDFQAESIRSNSLLVDLTEGTFIDELIKANKIATFRRNNSVNISAALMEIMSKKSTELSERMSRAETIIKTCLQTAPIYLAGSRLDIKQKDGKDRLQDALKAVVRQDYFKLNLVSSFYNDQKSVFTMLTDKNPDLFDLSTHPNKKAFDEILAKLKDDKRLMRTSTVKSLLDYFSKKPYGWRDLDILGMIGLLWRNNLLQILIHDNVVDEKNIIFKNDLSRKNSVDTMVVRLKEVIDETILYQVKRIMNDVYSVSLPLEEKALKEGVIDFFDTKRKFLADLGTKQGTEYAGSKAANEIHKDFNAILRSSDAATIFNEILARQDSLEDKAETLEQLERFYKEDSPQHQNFKEALSIIDWYTTNYLLENLESLKPVVDGMKTITSMDMPFKEMSKLADLVFQAKEITNKIKEEKYNQTRKSLEDDCSNIQKELQEALNLSLTDEKRKQLQDKADEISNQYGKWLKTITATTSNLDSYITASRSTVDGFRKFVTAIVNAGSQPKPHSKLVKLIDCIPVANKTVSSAEDVEKIVQTIRDRLLNELHDNDELKLS